MTDLRQKVRDAKLKTACCCEFISCLYFNADCFGCESIEACFCCRSESKCSIYECSAKHTCFKSPHDGKVCGQDFCTFTKSLCQCCCIVYGCALPCDDEVPCMFGICGWLCIDKSVKK